MTWFYFVRPNDSLFVRGNLAFGDSGEHGGGVMPPPPSLFAGAFRSALLGRDPHALGRYVERGSTGTTELDAVLGSINSQTGRQATQGSFRITWFSLAALVAGRPSRDGRAGASGGAPEAIVPLPADLVSVDSGLLPLTPEETAGDGSLVADGGVLPRRAMLRTARQEKPRSGLYLREAGWVKHLNGTGPDRRLDTVDAARVHARDPRLGIALNRGSRTVETGLLYTTEGHAFSPPPSTEVGPESLEAVRFSETGFLIGVDGSGDLLPEEGFLRLGGDGRGAHYRRVEWRPPDPPRDAIARSGRFRLILTTPGLFPSAPSSEARAPAAGWLPGGVSREGSDYVLRAGPCAARLVCAAVPRREVVSGWDLFRWGPKDALRAAPTGSVYWFEGLEGDPGKLAGWVAAGLWGENPDTQRRAEGYNLATLGAWN